MHLCICVHLCIRVHLCAFLHVGIWFKNMIDLVLTLGMQIVGLEFKQFLFSSKLFDVNIGFLVNICNLTKSFQAWAQLF